jgi:two-component system, OmpR family, sensor histidine kinase BaeS
MTLPICFNPDYDVGNKNRNFIPAGLELMKFNVTQRVFLAILAANAIIVLCMFLIMQWSMDRGFLKYVNQLEQNRMGRLTEKLGRSYSSKGGWEFLKNNPEAILPLLSETYAEDPTQSPASPIAIEAKRDAPNQPEPSSRRRFYRLERRIVVQDAAHNPVYGVGNPVDIELFKPILIKGTVVGYLGLLPNKILSDMHQLKFVKEQKLVFALIALLMLFVAAAISLPLARLLVRPLRKLAAATGHLSSGRYDVRVPVDTDDEFGHLSRDFNALALSLDKNEQARRQFVADISHELRTPLAILGGEIEAIQDGIQDLSLESIGSLQVEVFRINRLVDDLYQLALSDVGALAYRKSDVNLTDVLCDSIDRARSKLAERSLTLRALLPQEPAFVFADAERLTQLFDNVLDNSQKYTNQGGILDITLEMSHGGATIDIKDSEPGVTEEERRQLFNRLYRVEGSRNRASGGAGLGLSICRNIVEAHEGAIEALHSPFGGIWIRITLPLSEAANE